MNAIPADDTRMRWTPVAKSPAGFDLHRLDWGVPRADDEAVVDVVLVHGLTGDPLATWGMSSGSDAACTGWPIELAKSLRAEMQLWTAGYPAPLFSSGNATLSLEQLGRDALSGLAQAGLGQRKILFVAHSLGGILVKETLHASVLSSAGSNQQLVAGNTHGVVFVGTPHAGSDLTLLRHAVPWVAKAVAGGLGWLVATLLGGAVTASTVAGVSFFGFDWKATAGGLLTGLAVPLVAFLLYALFRPSEHVLNLDPDNPILHDATHHYRRLLGQRAFATHAFFERQRMWLLFKAVPRGSADPGVTDCTPVGLEANHVSMCKGAKAQPIAATIRTLIEAARRGIDVPVFESYLVPRVFKPGVFQTVRPLLRRPDGAYVKRFADVAGDRQQSESDLREHLRSQARLSEPPSAVELQLAETSTFDVDVFVWCFWHERNAIRSQRKLRLGAAAAMARWEQEFKFPWPSLIPFYRPMRTLEHSLRADLADDSTKTERECIREFIAKARKQLDDWCAVAHDDGKQGQRPWALDGEGGTRRLLLRMQCALEVADASDDFFKRVANGRHEIVSKHRSDLILWRGQNAAAQDAFNGALGAAAPGAGAGQAATD